jgi:hypothetical protein
MATRRCGCGLALEEAGAALSCPACGPAAVWCVQLEDGPVVAAATTVELVIAPELEEALLAGLAEAPAHPVPDFRRLMRRSRRGSS